MADKLSMTEDFAAKFATEKDKNTPYVKWVESEGLEIIPAHYIPNLRHVELKPWARRGGRGVYINHEASRTSNDCYVCEIPAGKSLAPHRQLFEEMVLVLDGRGSTTVWNDAGAKITFEWKAGAMFAVPLNCWHRHFNGSGQERVRYVAVTNGPSVMNLYDDPAFVFGFPYDFKNRFNGEPDYFTAKGEQKGLAAGNELRAGRGEPAADFGQGARRRRRSYPLQHGERLDPQPYLAISRRHLQKGPPPRARRACRRAIRRRLFADVGRRRRTAPLRLAGRYIDRTAQPHLPSAFQCGRGSGALSGVQIFFAAQRPRRAAVMDIQAHGRQSDRLCRRDAATAQHVFGRARQTRAETAHGRGVRKKPLRCRRARCNRHAPTLEPRIDGGIVCRTSRCGIHRSVHLCGAGPPATPGSRREGRSASDVLFLADPQFGAGTRHRERLQKEISLCRHRILARHRGRHHAENSSRDARRRARGRRAGRKRAGAADGEGECAAEIRVPGSGENSGRNIATHRA